MEILQFIFQDFAHWLGSFVLLLVIMSGIASAFRKERVIYVSKKDKEEDN
jgi:putative Mn2+ efflux pump MntP